MAITFRVNLQTVDSLSNRQPYNLSDVANFSTSRSTWFPDLLLNNRVLKHGDTVVVSGQQAIYLLNNYTSGEFKFLDYVSGIAT